MSRYCLINKSSQNVRDTFKANECGFLPLLDELVDQEFSRIKRYIVGELPTRFANSKVER
jgi:hypothetical protein